MNYNLNIIHEVELQRMYVDGRVDNPCLLHLFDHEHAHRLHVVAPFDCTGSSAPLTFASSTSISHIKTFVHEIFKRSHTSGSILQATLCYLEAIDTKVPEILQQENMGLRTH